MSSLPETLNYLHHRRSVTLPFLQEPGPSPSELEELLKIGLRVPDHGKLAPWRLVLYSGDARAEIGERLASICVAETPDLSEEAREKERNQFLPAPLTIGVISCPKDHPKIPKIEQLLSAGAVAFNLVHAANALGFGAHWVTRWFAYHAEAAEMLGAGPDEQFVGFVHIGTPTSRLEDRPRPDISQAVTTWKS